MHTLYSTICTCLFFAKYFNGALFLEKKWYYTRKKIEPILFSQNLRYTVVLATDSLIDAKSTLRPVK